ncbi:MAG TPA: hypothetical protein VE863_12040, partial [Pyrinomonadaceae bacterium]|nr:hypothetical protein [Pyrinomonadaceae bacterium]
MRRSIESVLRILFPIVIVPLLVSFSATAQKKNAEPSGPLMTRTTTRHESYRLSFGGTVTLIGAPAGSITIEGWQKNEVDLT